MTHNNESTNSGAPIQFDYAPEFRRINAEAQRRYYEQVEPPYLTWHFASWPREAPDFSKAGAMKAIQAQEDWITEEINAFLKQLGVTKDFQFRLEGDKNQHRRDIKSVGLEFPRFVTRDVFTIFGQLDGLADMMLRVEVHSEYVAFTFILPIKEPALPWLGTRTPAPPDDHPLSGNPFTKTRTDAIDQLVEKVFRDILYLPEKESLKDYKDRAAKHWDRLYNEAWRLAFETKKELKAPGHVFANFRGIVLPRYWLSPAYGQGELNAHIQAWEEEGKNERFWISDLEGRPAVPEDENHEHKDGEVEKPSSPRRWNRVSAGRALEVNSPLRRAMHWPGGERPAAESETDLLKRRTIANLVIDGRAMFVSTFGAGLEFRGEVGDDVDPNDTAGRYSLFYCREDEYAAHRALDRRLDRVVQRLHSLGTRRSIGLKQLDEIWRANFKLRVIDDKIARQFKQRRVSSRRIRDITRDIATVLSSVEGGLDYRVSRARYYASDFADTLNDLSLDRVEGWEPYNEFARRRLLPQWNNISKIGERAAQLRQRYDRLVDLFNAQQAEAQAEGAIWVGALATTTAISMFALGTGILGLPVEFVRGLDLSINQASILLIFIAVLGFAGLQIVVVSIARWLSRRHLRWPWHWFDR